MHVELAGEDGPQILLVHGSFVFGWQAWGAQRPMAERFRLVVPSRSGYPPNPPLERIDFETQAGEIAELIEPGMHVVGHSYGGIVALLAAARVPERVRSMTVIEPPAFDVARGDPAVEAFIARVAAFFADGERPLRDFIVRFAALVGAVPLPVLPDPLPPTIVAAANAARAERHPWEARLPLDELRRASFPKLVFSGAHSAALDAVCDVLVERLAAERAVITGAGHTVSRTGEPFNERLRTFVEANDGA